MGIQSKLTAFYRVASHALFSPRWDSESPYTAPLVGSVGVGVPVEEFNIFVEILPREVGDIVGKTFEQISHARGAVNYSVGYESVHDAVIDLERVGTGVLRHVESENLLLVFCKTLKAVNDFLLRPFYLPLPRVVGDEKVFQPDAARHYDNRSRNEKCCAKPRAIILCKFSKAESFEEAIACKQDEAGRDCDYREVTWGESKELRRRCGNRVDHFFRENTD